MSKTAVQTPTSTDEPPVQWQDGPVNDPSPDQVAAGVREDQERFAHLIAMASTVSPDDSTTSPPIGDDSDVSAAAAERQAAHDEVRAAEEALAEASSTVELAAEKVAAAEQDVIDRQQAFINPTDAIPDGESALSPERVKPAREAVEKAQDDLTWWSGTALPAAEAAYARANERAARAHRAIVALDYLAARAEYNDPRNRIAQLHDQLTATLFELIPLIHERRDTHDRLARTIASWPQDERRQITAGPGRPLREESISDLNVVKPIALPVPFPEVRSAIMLGVQAAVEAGSDPENIDYTTALNTAKRTLIGNRLIDE